ncbi:TPA: helix-turn-helix transcriptional regulator [Legionella pneumophila]|jgi:transcriptional regulator with XRE-family HTH domain|uniref:helix-turn-helix domain-containing protein n=1 Tax=Legionella pneumophila TaxID=446 RepID=UPI001A261E22|nr:helix-turn-helix transcriptional regulator [Legionella pneumophila]MCZ4786697.1 helix-turn-helix transcriptional regulator [Legionella pneumophila]HAU0134653.1 helix-turn-helix transcriptional regulator [Legionella pneumophila]HAU1915548.1 helix-turn-helix transcriptional regulator [Legionella pneumophila]
MKKQTQLTQIGEQIRLIRKQKGFSQENFANFIEMNRGYYGTVERGEANVTVLNLLKILKGLNATPNDLIPPQVYQNED